MSTSADNLAAELVPGHLACIGCGYDLHAQPRAGQCPECGRRVGESFLAEKLDLYYLRKAVWPLVLNPWLSAASVGAALLYLVALDSFGESAAGLIVSWVGLSLVFLLTVVSATMFTYRFARGGMRVGVSDILRRTLAPSFFAAIGLLLLDGAGLGMMMFRPSSDWAKPIIIVLAIGYALLGVTSYRFIRLYRAMGRIPFVLGWPRLERFTRFVGWAKAVYETLWLGICMAVGLATIEWNNDVAVFLLICGLWGLFGFAGISLLMVVCHTLLARCIRRATVSSD
ncbi:MAG: hypothetical protein QM770_23170 [Tepidisphaeraceae bacterium]